MKCSEFYPKNAAVNVRRAYIRQHRNIDVLVVKMKLLGIVLFLTVVGCTLAAGPGMARYDDFKVYKIYIRNEQQLSQLKKFRDTLPVC